MHTDPALAAHLRQLEESLTQPDVRHSREALARLLAEDFREFGSSGRIFDRQRIIEALQGQPQLHIEIEDFEVQCLAPDLALATYRGRVVMPASGTRLNSLRSSIWRRREDRWEMVFHQGTPA